MNTNDTDRTLSHAVAEVQFAIEFGSLNERFWQRTDTLLTVAQIVAGSLAFAGAFFEPRILGKVGLLMAVVSGVQLALQPGRKAVSFRDARATFHELQKRAWQMSLPELDAALQELRKTAPQGLDSLNQPAINRVERREGAEQVASLRWHERLASVLA